MVLPTSLMSFFSPGGAIANGATYISDVVFFLSTTMLSEQCLFLKQAHKPNLTWITLLHCNERKLLLLSYLALQNVTSAAMYNVHVGRVIYG